MEHESLTRLTVRDVSVGGVRLRIATAGSGVRLLLLNGIGAASTCGAPC